MDDEFDLYGDADIYGSGDAAAKDEENKADFQPDSGHSAGANGDGPTGNKRSREEDISRDVKPQQGEAGPSSYSQSSGPGAGTAAMQQDAPRPLDEPIDPASARLALAGRPKVTDPNVQNALYVGELDWWVSDENIRRIANDIGIPISLSDVTFSEHKVNGKSKGVCFVETASEDEANHLKQWFENNDLNFKRASVTVSTSANGNPFKTLPKDPPPREARAPRGTMRGAMAMGARENNRGGGNMGGGYGQGQQAFPMAGAPIRMGSGGGGAGGGAGNAAGGGMPMMNPMMMGMMGAAGGRGGFNNPMAFMGGGGRGGGGGWGGRGRGQGHFNPNFFGGGGGRGGGNSGPPGGNDDRERKRYRTDDGGY